MNLSVPKRAFGNTGAQISKLCLGGGVLDTAASEGLLEQALACGVDCWETTMLFGVQRFRAFFSKHEGARERVFLTAKASSCDPHVMQAQLDQTLQALDTPAIDFFAIHGVSDLAVLGNDVRRWAEQAKRDKKIKLFGFCTHKNMDRCLAGAAAMGWIDGIQTAYNYRLQRVPSMQHALQACHEKGVGLIGIKSMGLCVAHKSELQNLPMTEDLLSARLAKHGLSFAQAKLRAAWQSPALTSICSLMPEPGILRENAEAACDEAPMPDEAMELLEEYAACTSSSACLHCGAICESRSADRMPIFEVMYALLFARGYGERALASKVFQRIEPELRARLASSDYVGAEAACPQHLPIARLMREAVEELSG